MEIKDIIFDENFSFQFRIAEQNDEITLQLSDSLRAMHEILTLEYKTKLFNFINASKVWYPRAIDAVRHWGAKIYNRSDGEVLLVIVYVRFEQNDTEELFGLEFRPDFDVEHGCGVKINGITNEILEVGEGDIAFC